MSDYEYDEQAEPTKAPMLLLSVATVVVLCGLIAIPAILVGRQPVEKAKVVRVQHGPQDDRQPLPNPDRARPQPPDPAPPGPQPPDPARPRPQPPDPAPPRPQPPDPPPVDPIENVVKPAGGDGNVIFRGRVKEETTPVPGRLFKIQPVRNYERREINGFTMLLSKEAIEEAKKIKGKPFRALTLEFDGLVEVLPANAKTVLRHVSIWVAWDDRDRHDPSVLARYYGGLAAVKVLSLKRMAAEKGLFAAEKALPVERTRLVLLHELAHAVHDRLLPLGFNNRGVDSAYKQAMERGHYKGAYAAKNSAEYFAELTCAYLDCCNGFPFNREELKEKDLIGYQLMEGVWKVKRQ